MPRIEWIEDAVCCQIIVSSSNPHIQFYFDIRLLYVCVCAVGWKAIHTHTNASTNVPHNNGKQWKATQSFSNNSKIESSQNGNWIGMMRSIRSAYK